MYYLFKMFEYAFNFIKVKLKIIYWKLKYGKNIKIGKNLKFRKNLSINMTKNAKLEIGNNVFFNNNCSINCHNNIIIQDSNLFGENVMLYDHNHVFNNSKIERKKAFNNGKIIIGKNNWIGSNSVFLSKTEIGDNNVIGCLTIINDNYGSNLIIKQSNSIKKQNIVYTGDEND